MESTVETRKATSNYKKGKVDTWKEKSSGKDKDTDKPGSKAADKNGSKPGGDSKCPYCGSKKNHSKEECRAREAKCNKCGKIGHYQAVCRSPQAAPASGSRTGRVEVVNCKRVATKVQDDSEPTPLMKGVKIKPIGGKHKAVAVDTFPDTGCQQSLVSEDLMSACGLQLDRTKKKRIKAVDGGDVACIGSTSFQASYGGRTTDILALVTPALRGEVILSWRSLQRLGVVPKEFPMPQADVKIQKVQEIHSPKETPPKRVSQRDPPKETPPKRMSQRDLPKEIVTPEHTLEEEVDALKKEFEDVFKVNEELKIMEGDPMKIELIDNVVIKPLHVNTPRKTPYAFQGAAKARIADEKLKHHLDRREKEHEKVKEQVDRSRCVEPFQFRPGDKVWVQDHKSKRWTVQATVVSSRSERSFIVNDGTRDFIRNKRFMRLRYG